MSFKNNEIILEVKNLMKTYQNNIIFDELNLKLSLGEVVGIIGPNGVGKSTFLNIISGFENADSGSIFYKNSLINNIKPYKIARLGIVRTFQEGSLFPDLTVLENLLLALKSNLLAWQYLQQEIKNMLNFNSVNQNDKKLFLELLGEFNLESKIDQKVYNLSTGEKRLVELVRIKLQKWDLLLLDEPLAGVSSKYFDFIKNFIAEISAQNKTVIIVEHNHSFVQNAATRVIHFQSKVCIH